MSSSCPMRVNVRSGRPSRLASTAGTNACKDAQNTARQLGSSCVALVKRIACAQGSNTAMPDDQVRYTAKIHSG